MKLENEILTTRGVNSCVRLPADGEFTAGKRWWTKYHVGLFDFDMFPKQRVLEAALELSGINILWQSSQSSYHLWNLSLREPDEIATIGLRMNADCKHVGHGFRRRKWVLRVAGKFHEGETEPYKPAPTSVQTWFNHDSRPQSLPHARLYAALTGRKLQERDSYNFVGESAQIEDYKTVTDRMKHGLQKWGR